jgi:UDP-glucose 4-epimerase
MSKILVTGAAGFVGSHLCDLLLAQGHSVVGLDDLSAGSEKHLDPRVKLYKHSILLPGLRSILGVEKPDVVCHLAALASVIESNDDPVRYLEVNVLGSVKLLEAMRYENVSRIVYASSGGTVYGDMWNRGRKYFIEDDEPMPQSVYGASKHHVEHHLRAYYRLHRINWASLRLGNVYGPREVRGIVPTLAKLMREGRPVRMRGDGTQVRDYVYVQDVAQAFSLACFSGGGIINIGSGVGTTSLGVFRLLAAILGYKDEPAWMSLGPGEINEVVLNCGHAAEMLGWKASTSLEDGLRATVEGMR